MRLPGDLDAGFLDSLFEAACVLDLDQTILFWNNAAMEITGISADTVTGLKCADSRLEPVDMDGKQLYCDDSCPAVEAIRSGSEVRKQVFLMHREGHRIPIRMKVIPLGGKEDVEGALILFREDALLEELRERLRELEKLSCVDSITGVANRRHAVHHIQSKKAELERYGNSFALFLVDVDGFDAINREFGHFTGDRVLRMVANSVICTLRPFDLLARWGADEFIVSVWHTCEDDLKGIGERIRMIVSSSTLTSPGGPVSTSVSIAGAVARADETMDDLIERMEDLLRRAKKEGGNRVLTE